MKRRSAGLLMYRIRDGVPQVLLIHPGGPFWTRKDAGAWSIPKGEYDDDEDPLTAAKREFVEETGFVPGATFVELQPIRQAGGKKVMAWAFEGDCDPSQMVSNTFEIEWPPRSGRMATFPEADKAAWFDLETARGKMHVGQLPFLEELDTVIRHGGSRSPRVSLISGSNQ